MTFATSLDTDQSNLFIGDEIIESSNRVAPSTDASDNSIRQLASHFLQLLFDLFANNTLEVSNNGGERMRA
jgi:hypothetical protein